MCQHLRKFVFGRSWSLRL